jgi:UDP-2,3-diacylglucosamine hydrolase
VTRIIHGHTHRPARHSHVVDGQARERHVLAAWHGAGSYLAVDENGVHVHVVTGDSA